MAYDTQTRSQFIDLRARGWSYAKIARHTGISKSTLLTWGRQYADHIARLKYEHLFRIAPDIASPEGAQESYFHNLEGYPEEPGPKSKIEIRNSKIRSQKPASFRKRVVKKVRRLLKSPLVRAAIRYAIFKR